MSKIDRWLLPDGIEELLPEEARCTENIRRRLIDTFERWGYDFVIPPLVEFTDSLLTGSGSDIDLLTFKLTDQGTGKMMGVRADITPQAARMDAHSLRRAGVNRLCYTGPVLHTRSKSPVASRAPIIAGVELFGEKSINADLEVISLLIETLQALGFKKQYMDIGHVGIFKSFIEEAGLTKEQERAFFEILQSKAISDTEAWLEQNVSDKNLKSWLRELPRLSGSSEVLEKANKIFKGAPAGVHSALAELMCVAENLSKRYPDAQAYFDLSELRGFHYHTGIVFGAFAPGFGNAIADGGRYDHVGEAFGRARPATGFNINVSSIARLVDKNNASAQSGVFVRYDESEALWRFVSSLRDQGKRVVIDYSGAKGPLDYQGCDQIVELCDSKYCLVAIEK